MKKWEFPNQKCAVKNCGRKRKHLVIFVGLCMNLCSYHFADLEDKKPLTLKDWNYENAVRTIEE
jgi:hypothetical protein